MTLKNYLSLMAIATLFCWLAFVVVIFYINPELAGGWGFFIFYLSLFLSSVGTLSLLGFFARVWIIHNLPVLKLVVIAFRQAVMFSSLIIFLLILQGFSLLRWWNIVLFVLFLASLEFCFISGRHKQME